MRLFIKTKPGAKIEQVKKIDETHFEVWVKEPPKEGKANEALLKVLAKYFGIPKSRLEIISGQASKQKIIEIIF